MKRHFPLCLFYSPDALYGSIEFELESGTSLEESEEAAKQIENVMNMLPANEIDGYTLTIGNKMSDIATHGNRISHSAVGNFLVFLSPYKKRERNSTTIMKDLDKQLKEIEGFKKIKAYSLKDGPPVGRAVTITIVSNDNMQRNNAKNLVINTLEAQDGFYNLDVSEGKGKERVEVILNKEKAAKLDVGFPAISNAITTFYKGSIASNVLWNNEELNVRITVPNENKRSIDNMNSILVRNNKGKLIKLKEIVDIESHPDVLNITHYDKSRSITIYGDVDETKNNIMKIKSENNTWDSKRNGAHYD